MGFRGKKWELVGDRGIYRNYGRYTLSWGLKMDCDQLLAYGLFVLFIDKMITPQSDTTDTHSS